MNEIPKSIWKRSWKLPGLLMAWLVLMAVTIVVFVTITALLNDPWSRGREVPGLLLFGALFATSVLGLWLVVRWLCCWQNLRKFCFGLACLATLVALFYAEEDWRGRHTWGQFKHEWEAKGVHFELASLVPPPVPDNQNFAMTPIAFTSYGQLLTREGKVIPGPQRDTNFVVRMHVALSDQYDDPTNGAGDWSRGTAVSLPAWQAYYRELALKTNRFPVPPQPGAPAADVLLALGSSAPVIEELRVASQLPASRFPLAYDHESPAEILLPHLAPLKDCARVLRLRSVAELQAGQSELALADVQLGLYLADTVRTEPILISHLVRLVMFRLTLQPVWEGLANHAWSEAQLVALETALAKRDFAADYQWSMRGEMAFSNSELEHLRRHPEELENLRAFNYADSSGNDCFLPPGPLARLIPNGWFDQNIYRCERTVMEYYFPVADVAQGTFMPDLARRGDAAVAAEVKAPSPFNQLALVTLPALGNAARHFAFAQAALAQARTAIALERYRLAQGSFPESLEALVPKYLVALPRDVVGGQPMKYRRNAKDQFLLYSVGWNGTDDGGVRAYEKGSAHNVDSSQGDWLWQYPVDGK